MCYNYNLRQFGLLQINYDSGCVITIYDSSAYHKLRQRAITIYDRYRLLKNTAEEHYYNLRLHTRV